METDLTIRALTNQDTDFYPTMGPYLSRRPIVDELGGPIWDDDGKTWLVAVTGGQVNGFVAAAPRDGYTAYQSAYVLPPHRGRGVYRRLWQARRDMFPGPARAVCTPAALPTFVAAGWTITGTKGSYTRVETL
jgi:GNAT superfamily N-acetyltransferase